MSIRGSKNTNAKKKKINKPKKSAKDAVEESVKDAVEEPVKDAGDDAGDDADKESGNDADKESSNDAVEQPLIIAAKTKQELVGKNSVSSDAAKFKEKNSVSSDAEEFFENIAKTRDLTLKRRVHKAVLYNVGGAQHFLNDTMDRAHDRWKKMVRIAPRSLLRELCLDLGAVTKHRPLHNLMAKHSNTYLTYLMREGLSSAKDLRRLYAGKKPSCGNLKDLATKKAKQEKQDESAPLHYACRRSQSVRAGA